MWKLAGKARLKNEMQVDFPHLYVRLPGMEICSKRLRTEPGTQTKDAEPGTVDAAETRLPVDVRDEKIGPRWLRSCSITGERKL